MSNMANAKSVDSTPSNQKCRIKIVCEKFLKTSTNAQTKDDRDNENTCNLTVVPTRMRCFEINGYSHHRDGFMETLKQHVVHAHCSIGNRTKQTQKFTSFCRDARFHPQKIAIFDKSPQLLDRTGKRKCA